MGFKAFLDRELGLFTRSFVGIDRRFLYVFILEVILIAAIALSASMWNDSIMSLGKDIAEFRGELDALGGAGNLYAVEMRDEAAAGILSKVVTSSLLFGVFVLLAWTLIKHKIFCIVTRKAFSKHTYWRFLIISLIWIVVSFLLFNFIQYFIYLAWGGTFEISFWSRFWVLLTMTALYLVLFWFGLNLFTHLVRTGRIAAALKGTYVIGLKRFGRFIIPLIFSVVLMLLVNVAMYLLVLSTWELMFFFGSAVLLLLYFTFLRFYYTDIIDDCAPKRPEKKMVRRKDASSAVKGGSKKK